ncbi:MAG: ExeM/NucH family extracellular endonuclease [Pseudomonadota bacterium]
MKITKIAALLVLNWLFSANALANLAGQTPISTIQGNGNASALVGQTVTTSGIVVGDFQGVAASSSLHPRQLQGFFLQSLTPDSDLFTSEGIFVFCSTCPDVVTVGDLVTVSGSVAERFGMTAIEATSEGSVVVTGSGAPPVPESITLPVSSLDDYERYEGMLVRFPDELQVTGTHRLTNFGEVLLRASSAFQFTQVNPPNSVAYDAFLDNIAVSQVILDDDANGSVQALIEDLNIFHPVPGFSSANFLRGGDRISGLIGIMDFNFGNWRLRPVLEVVTPTFTRPEPRPDAPARDESALRLASWNVNNFFATIDTTATNIGVCGPPNIAFDCRGADSASELQRQLDKIVATICELDADIIALQEIQNPSGATLGLLTVAVANTCGGAWNFVDTGLLAEQAIAVGLIYRGSVTPVGDHFIVDNAFNPSYHDDRNRPTVIQVFEHTSSGEQIVVANTHLVAKSANCSDLGDPDLNDGQGGCSNTRNMAAGIIDDFLDIVVEPTLAEGTPIVLAGDFNSYAAETTIQTLLGRGYTNLINPGDYSFVFDGLLGSLDYIFLRGLSAINPKASVWHINADEADLLDYNDTINDTGEAASEAKPDNLLLYAADQWRSSDHDPVVVDIPFGASNAATVKQVPIPHLMLALVGLVIIFNVMRAQAKRR